MARSRKAPAELAIQARDAEVRTLAKGLEILSLFRPDRHTMTVEEIAHHLDLPKSSTYRLVATLKDRGYLRKAPGRDGYTLDATLLRFGEVVRASSQLHEIAQPFMEELVIGSRESAALVVRSGDRAAVVAKVDSPEMIKVIPEAGWSYPLHAGSAGKVFLAYAEPADFQRYLQRDLEAVTEKTITDKRALEQECERVRRQGYAVVDEELMLGGLSIATPVVGPDGKLEASLSIAGPVVRFTSKRALETIPFLVDCSNRMSIELGASEGQLRAFAGATNGKQPSARSRQRA